MRSLSIATLAAIALAAGCSVPSPMAREPQGPRPVAVHDAPPPAAGTYQIQSISYDDASGQYRVFLIDPPSGQAPVWSSRDMRMARLTDAEMANGTGAHLVSEGLGTSPTAKLPPDFQIGYVHNVVEDHGGEPVVVRQETSMWSPFASAMMGAMVGNMLFSPMYMMPPPYVRGGPLLGAGGVGTTASAAQQAYAQKHGALPQPSRLAKSGYSQVPSPGSVKASGSGAGSNRFKQGTGTPMPSKRTFGSRGFGRRR